LAVVSLLTSHWTALIPTLSPLPFLLFSILPLQITLLYSSIDEQITSSLLSCTP